jgi:hypothetical protein
MVLAHEGARSQRMADFFEARVNDPVMNRPRSMAQLLLAVSVQPAMNLEDLKKGLASAA